ncbi:zinc finger protein 280C-like [Engraulis encrasicolus]|uniref:zinc finger protein 280C-like n=1 Tax=Engraulis encrasicolus TaxID=184585 RepID=UPI002FD07CD9
MSELFMECEEEELEPWQKAIPEINLIDDDDDDDEPIFVGEIQSSKPTTNARPGVQRGQQNAAPGRRPVGSTPTTPQKLPHTAAPAPQRASYAPAPPHTQHSPRAAPTLGNNPSLVPANQAGMQNAAGRLGNTMTAQPIIINSQGYIVSSPQMSSSGSFIANMGSQYPPATSFTLLPGQQLLQSSSSPQVSHAVHRPQVQLMQNNVITLANVQQPPDLTSHQQGRGPQHRGQPPHANSSAALSSLQGHHNRDNGTMKRGMASDADNKNKRIKMDAGGHLRASENDSPTRRRCPNCSSFYPGDDSLKGHMRFCCPDLLETVFPSSSYGAARQERERLQPPPQPQGAPVRIYDAHDKSKLIMLVSDFYYGRADGDRKGEQKTNTTFKCNSCLKVLKNNIRFMNHMKHHLELEKQNSESWESHTTCQHCYRQYSTPFQLQCHIESAHSHYESTTNCKICELAFDTEQVLLEHMKDNHKPGEMPYACQVCNYRSSFFSDVESHFRSIHDNTKDLLCPFCLKVLRSGHMYMNHYMRHQKKGIHRCGKCRLNFLTYKEKVEHKTVFHRTYRKPRTLEGLPPGTKVTIRASLAGSPTSPSTPGRSSISVVPSSPGGKQVGRPPGSGGGRGKTAQHAANPPGRPKKEKAKPETRNALLKNFRPLVEGVKCAECSEVIKDFYDHFPLLLTCGACKFKTCCRRAYKKHMTWAHGSGPKVPPSHKQPRPLRSLTLVCLNCDFLVDASSSNLMGRHLNDRPTHTCQVIQDPSGQSKPENDSVCDTDSLERSGLINAEPMTLIGEEGEETTGTHTTPKEEEGEGLEGETAAAKEEQEEKEEVEKYVEEKEEEVTEVREEEVVTEVREEEVVTEVREEEEEKEKEHTPPGVSDDSEGRDNNTPVQVKEDTPPPEQDEKTRLQPENDDEDTAMEQEEENTKGNEEQEEDSALEKEQRDKVETHRNDEKDSSAEQGPDEADTPSNSALQDPVEHMEPENGAAELLKNSTMESDSYSEPMQDSTMEPERSNSEPMEDHGTEQDPSPEPMQNSTVEQGSSKETTMEQGLSADVSENVGEEPESSAEQGELAATAAAVDPELEPEPALTSCLPQGATDSLDVAATPSSDLEDQSNATAQTSGPTGQSEPSNA